MIRAAIAFPVALVATGCVSANYVPTGATQEIGAVHHLSSSKARWTCLGGEELALVERAGKPPRLYIASQDLLVDQSSEDPRQRNFDFTRDPSMANATATSAMYSVPKDPQADLEVRFSRLFTTGRKSTSSTWRAGDTTYTSTTTRTSFGAYTLWSDRCVPRGTSEEASWARVYRGAERVEPGPLPPKRFVLGACAFNQGLDGKLRMDRRTDIDLQATVDLDLNRATALSALHTVNLAIVPPLAWANAEGGITLGRADGSGLELTHPINLWGTDGYLYERASVPVFVTLKPGSESVFLFVADPDPPPAGHTPRAVGSGINGTFAAWCRLHEVKS